MSSSLRQAGRIYLRNFVFGVEDSLVSTVGLLSGIAVADVARPTIVLTGVVLIFVEAFSMGVGSFLSEYSVEEYEEHREPASRKAAQGGIIMFLSYVVAGLIPLGPYMLAAIKEPLPVSVAASLGGLFILGILSGKLTHVRPGRMGFRMLVLGGSAILVGILIGGYFK